MTTTVDDDLSRLSRLEGSDPGFFVLAVHSFIEGFLRNLYTPACQEDDRYSWFLDCYYHDLVAGAERFIPELELIAKLKLQRQLTNGVRHEFGALHPEEARSAVELLRLVRPPRGLRNLARSGEARRVPVPVGREAQSLRAVPRARGARLPPPRGIEEKRRDDPPPRRVRCRDQAAQGLAAEKKRLEEPARRAGSHGRAKRRAGGQSAQTEVRPRGGAEGARRPRGRSRRRTEGEPRRARHPSPR